MENIVVSGLIHSWTQNSHRLHGIVEGKMEEADHLLPCPRELYPILVSSCHWSTQLPGLDNMNFGASPPPHYYELMPRNCKHD